MWLAAKCKLYVAFDRGLVTLDGAFGLALVIGLEVSSSDLGQTHRAAATTRSVD
jgi:hypothetical protein